MLSQLKALVPEPIVSVYHYMLARLAQLVYGNPSKDLTVIGVTGTNGKTTTTYFIAKALEASGHQTGCTTTAIMKVGNKEWLNKTKMTMPGRFFLQKTLRDMVKAGCKYAVIEVSSQGLIQHRHIGINYDLAVFTNLTPEHIEAHRGFENYKRAKRRLFEAVDKAVLNADSDFIEYYAQTPGLKKIEWYSVRARKGLFPESMTLDGNGSSFMAEGVSVRINQPGEYNVANALAALAVCKHYGVDLKKAAEKLEAIHTVPGRFERVEIGQPWTVVVDYAPEPESFQRLYDALDLVPKKRVIHILGSCGGGRDVARRPILGKLAAEHADIVVVTNEDPYDDDPSMIIDQVAEGAAKAGKRDGQNLFRVTDRREAIFKAMAMAREGDLVVMTGKGCEPWICLSNGRKMPWDEVAVAKEAIQAARNT
ncbi:UDP-N-acetylmuramyl-tripeptide synthetase [Patescibacteria group bacterium]|jgi:UDP-N-acetylmuramoyl-L-alanyl-D-glutamate--2,6-diaminopimelate ligase|nr:UDP-N-acetylmuramyl-tripeptide synthetase [Patescibacteria group bacterium]